MPVTVRTLRQGEGNLLKDLMVRMTAETPTAFRASLGELAQRTDEEWETMAGNIAASPNIDAFVAEKEAVACGFVVGSILIEQRLANIEGRQAGNEGDSLTDTTILGTMWVAPHARSQGLGQTLIQAVLTWAKEKNQRRVILAVTEGNDRALRSYTRAAFVQTHYSMLHPSYPELTIHFMEYVF